MGLLSTHTYTWPRGVLTLRFQKVNVWLVGFEDDVQSWANSNAEFGTDADDDWRSPTQGATHMWWSSVSHTELSDFNLAQFPFSHLLW